MPWCVVLTSGIQSMTAFERQLTLSITGPHTLWRRGSNGNFSKLLSRTFGEASETFSYMRESCDCHHNALDSSLSKDKCVLIPVLQGQGIWVACQYWITAAVDLGLGSFDSFSIFQLFWELCKQLISHVSIPTAGHLQRHVEFTM